MSIGPCPPRRRWRCWFCRRDWAIGAVVAGGIRRSPFPDQAVGAVDADMVLIAKGGDRQIDALRAVLGPSRSFWRSLAGLRFQSSGMRPSLMSFFSASVLRCLGAATIVASYQRLCWLTHGGLNEAVIAAGS